VILRREADPAVSFATFRTMDGHRRALQLPGARPLRVAGRAVAQQARLRRGP